MKPKAFARAYGSKERVAWVQSWHCLACGMHPCENVHITTGGTGRKADANFERRWKLDLDVESARIERLWQARNA